MRLSPKIPSGPVNQESEIQPLEATTSCESQDLKFQKLPWTSNGHYTWVKQYLRLLLARSMEGADSITLGKYGSGICLKQRRKKWWRRKKEIERKKEKYLLKVFLYPAFCFLFLHSSFISKISWGPNSYACIRRIQWGSERFSDLPKVIELIKPESGLWSDLSRFKIHSHFSTSNSRDT